MGKRKWRLLGLLPDDVTDGNFEEFSKTGQRHVEFPDRNSFLERDD
jgi:hypothetical protein